jgi:hypothetical protein
VGCINDYEQTDNVVVLAHHFLLLTCRHFQSLSVLLPPPIRNVINDPTGGAAAASSSTNGPLMLHARPLTSSTSFTTAIVLPDLGNAALAFVSRLWRHHDFIRSLETFYDPFLHFLNIIICIVAYRIK